MAKMAKRGGFLSAHVKRFSIFRLEVRGFVLPEEEVELTPLLLSAERSGPSVGLEGEGAGSGPQRYRTSSRRWS